MSGLPQNDTNVNGLSPPSYHVLHYLIVSKKFLSKKNSRLRKKLRNYLKFECFRK